MTRTWPVRPNEAALRKASRVAIVMTAMTALGHTSATEPAFGTFAGFGSLALLGFANYGGPLPVRFGLGVAFTVTGTVLVVLGTVASDHLAWSALLMLLVGFAVTYAGVLGGYAGASSRGLILAAALAVMLPGGTAELTGRITGWACGGLVGSIAMVALWPDRARPRFQADLAEAVARTADLLADPGRVTRADIDAAAGQVRALRAKVNAALARPAGQPTRDEALLRLPAELARTLAELARVIDEAPDLGGVPAEDVAALQASGRLLRATSARLLGETSADDAAGDEDADYDDLATAAVRQRGVLPDDLAPGATDAGNAPLPVPSAALLERFDVLLPVRLVSHLAASIATNALQATGTQRVDPADAARALRTHLRPRSRWFRNALRMGIALAAAATVTHVLRVDHGFWVVVATMSVLRGSVMETGSSAIQSVTGTVIGFGVATPLLLTVGSDSTLLWVALPIAVFTAMYLPGLVSFRISRAAFTVLVVILFSIAAPVGWEIGLVRVEDYALGVSIAVLVTFVLWPRGISHDLAVAVAENLDAAARYARSTFGSTLDGPTTAEPTAAATARGARTARHTARVTENLAESELVELMNSHGSQTAPPELWSRLVTRPEVIVTAGDWMGLAADLQHRPAVADSDAPTVRAATAAIERAADRAFTRLETAARLLEQSARSRHGDDDRPITTAPDEEAAATALTEARSALGRMLDDPSWRRDLAHHQVLGLVWALEWAVHLVELASAVDDDLATVGPALERSWWR